MRGHAMEFRINAEDPDRNFQPSPGTASRTFVAPAGPGVRWDSHIYEGYTRAAPLRFDDRQADRASAVTPRGDDRSRDRRALHELTTAGRVRDDQGTCSCRILRALGLLPRAKTDTGFIDRYFSPR